MRASRYQKPAMNSGHYMALAPRTLSRNLIQKAPNRARTYIPSFRSCSAFTPFFPNSGINYHSFSCIPAPFSDLTENSTLESSKLPTMNWKSCLLALGAAVGLASAQSSTAYTDPGTGIAYQSFSTVAAGGYIFGIALPTSPTDDFIGHIVCFCHPPFPSDSADGYSLRSALFPVGRAFLSAAR